MTLILWRCGKSWSLSEGVCFPYKLDRVTSMSGNDTVCVATLSRAHMVEGICICWLTIMMNPQRSVQAGRMRFHHRDVTKMQVSHSGILKTKWTVQQPYANKLLLTSAVFRHDLRVKSREMAKGFTQSLSLTRAQSSGRFPRVHNSIKSSSLFRGEIFIGLFYICDTAFSPGDLCFLRWKHHSQWIQRGILYRLHTTRSGGELRDSDICVQHMKYGITQCMSESSYSVTVCQ